MNYLAVWDKAVQKNFFLRFIDVLLKGYGQVLICHNSLTGLLFSAAIFFLSPQIWLLTLLAVFSASLTAFLVGGRKLHINAGVYGFNSVVLGIAWLWFFRMNTPSIILLLFAASLSSVFMKLLIRISDRTRTNLPVFSSISLVLIWFIFILIRYFFYFRHIIGPDKVIIEYLRIFGANFSLLSHIFTWNLFFKTFYKHIIAFLLIFLAVKVHSRISLRVGLISFFIVCVMIYNLGGINEFLSFDLYVYNVVPSSLALGGIFLVYNKKVFFLTLIAVFVTTYLTFIGLRFFPLPLFVLPFNSVTIFFIWLVKSNVLKREYGFYAMPMELVSTPEFGIQWYKGEVYADEYWRRIEESFDRRG